MVTAESVKNKLQGLIDTANATTGKEDVTLTAAVSSLVDGFGSSGGGNAEAYLAMLNGIDLQNAGDTLMIPEGVTRISNYFYHNRKVAQSNITVNLPGGLKVVEAYAFRGFAAGGESQIDGRGVHFILNDDLEEVANYGFGQLRYGTFQNIPSSLKIIGQSAFQWGGMLVSGWKYTDDLHLENAEVIGKDAFNSFAFAGANVYVGSSITSIGSSAFAFANKPVFTLWIDRPENSLSDPATWFGTSTTIPENVTIKWRDET